MPVIVCVSCEVQFRPEKNGVFVEECRGYDEDYKIWHADRYECPVCGVQIIAGFGNKPVVEHYDKAKYATLLPKVEHRNRERAQA